MKIYKGVYSEYAIAAFVRAAELGYPSLEKIKSISTSKPVREDLRAVYSTFETLHQSGEGETVRAVMAIYRPSHESGTRISRAILHERLSIYALGRSYSEESVYRMLANARRLFAKKRGLTAE